MKKPTGRLAGNDLVLTRSFEAPIEDVWASLTETGRTSRWYGSWTGAPGAGSTIRIRMLFEHDGAESVAHIDACEPPRRLALTTQGEWGVSIEITLAQTGSVTELRFVHHLVDRALARDFGPGWEYYLDNLVAARSGEPLPAFDEYHPAMQAHYTTTVDASAPMKKFLVLFTAAKSAKEQIAQTTPEQGRKGMEMWMAWMKKAGKAVVDGGAPLGPIGSASPRIGGYSVLEAESAEALEELLKDHPHRMAPGANIEIHEFLQMPGMG